jgi:hypothetical protein
MSNSATIENGTMVRFLRTEHNLDNFAATVVGSHRLFGGDGHHYVIDCPDFPHIIGFAHDEELFINPADAEALSVAAKKVAAARKRDDLLAERARIDLEIAAIPA